jgi:hypothetical protein
MYLSSLYTFGRNISRSDKYLSSCRGKSRNASSCKVSVTFFRFKLKSHMKIHLINFPNIKFLESPLDSTWAVLWVQTDEGWTDERILISAPQSCESACPKMQQNKSVGLFITRRNAMGVLDWLHVPQEMPYKKPWIYWPFERLSASHEEFCSMSLVKLVISLPVSLSVSFSTCTSIYVTCYATDPTSDTKCDVLRHWSHFWHQMWRVTPLIPLLTPVVTCYATEYTHFELLLPLFTNLTLQSVSTLFYIYTAHSLTHQYSTEHYLCRPTTAKLSLETLITNSWQLTKLLLQNWGWYRLGADRTESSLSPYCCERCLHSHC